jgi:hypothetical protein
MAKYLFEGRYNAEGIKGVLKSAAAAARPRSGGAQGVGRHIEAI